MFKIFILDTIPVSRPGGGAQPKALFLADSSDFDGVVDPLPMLQGFDSYNAAANWLEGHRRERCEYYIFPEA